MLNIILNSIEFYKKQNNLLKKKKELIKINKCMEQYHNYKIFYHEKKGLYI